MLGVHVEKTCLDFHDVFGTLCTILRKGSSNLLVITAVEIWTYHRVGGCFS